MMETRPWGNYKILLDQGSCKVKLISVKPGQRLSLQSHKKRSEHWTVVKGTATIWLDNEINDYTYNQSVYIDIGVKHRLENKTNEFVQIIEVQCGEYFGEDDIIRYEDDYKRK